MALRRDGKSKTHRVHRLVASAFLGPIPDGKEVNHRNGDKADNRAENLEVVTRSENIRHSIDVLGNRHWGVGEAHGNAKLTEAQVLNLRERADSGESYGSLGRAFRISDVQAMSIARGESWPHVGGPRTEPRPAGKRPAPKGAANPAAKLAEEDVVAIRHRIAEGAKRKDVAAAFGISENQLRSIATGKSWKHAGGPITPSRSQRAKPSEVVARIGPGVVAEVRCRHAGGEGTTALARELGVSKRTILNWVQGKTRQE